MPTYTVRYDNVPLSLAVTVQAESEEEAADTAWKQCEEYLDTLWGHGDVIAAATLDGHGHDEIEEVDE